MQQIISLEIGNTLEMNSEGLFAAEESATFWLWAYPSLLNWPGKLEWLFSPVVGNSDYPGDLWGIDDSGNLLLIETKRGKRTDPFQDFVNFEKSGMKTAVSVEKVAKRWKNLYESERRFWQNHETDLRRQSLEQITAKGVVPYSSKRYATRRWPALYAEVIAPRLFSEPTYAENVGHYLEIRNQSNITTIYYVGLVLVNEPNLLTLSTKGHDHYLKLMSLVGNERVILTGITAWKSQVEQGVVLQAWQANTGCAL